MGQTTFLRSLVEHASVRVATATSSSEADDFDCDGAIEEWAMANQPEFPGTPPPLSLEVARWALRSFYHACQYLVCRDVDAETITTALGTPCPPAPAASRHYSTDLIFRLLPDLSRMAKSVSENDPLCDHLRQWAREWPLSSVGIANVAPIDVSVICDHAGLLRLYVDRIILRGDVSRLNDPRVRVAVRAGIGVFDHLAPSIAAALQDSDPATIPMAASAISPE